MSDEHNGHCWVCKAEVGDDMFCYGCQKFVCDACDMRPDLVGPHEPEAHLGEVL